MLLTIISKLFICPKVNIEKGCIMKKMELTR